MATEGGDQRTGNAAPVPVPVVTGRNFFTGKKPLVAWFVFFHGLVSAVLLAILVVVVVDKGDAYDRMREVARVLGNKSGVEILAAMLMLALLRNGWWSPVLAYVAIMVVILTVILSARLLYAAMFGRDCCFIGDALKAAVPILVVVLGQLGLSFWAARVVAPYKSGGNSQSQTSVHRASSIQSQTSVHRASSI